jgi:Phytase
MRSPLADRPNNCAVEGDLLLTTDPGAGDVKVHRVPDLALLRTFGDDMGKPEGIDVLTTPAGLRLVYATDSSDSSVHAYDLDSGLLVGSFPTTFGAGIEPILADDHYQRIFVARGEDETIMRLGWFTPDGTLVEEFGEPFFARDPEGMAIYACGSGGYLVAVDQKSGATDFEVFDRVTLTHLGRFHLKDVTGGFTDNTDGIDILQTPLPGFPGGMMAACDGCGSAVPDAMDVVAWDRIAAAMGLAVCPNGRPPGCGDGMAEGSFEECDGADDAACPGLCADDCTCPLPVSTPTTSTTSTTSTTAPPTTSTTEAPSPTTSTTSSTSTTSTTTSTLPPEDAPRVMQEGVLAVLVDLRDQDVDKDGAKKLDEAIVALGRAVDAAGWRDDSRPQPDTGSDVLEDEKTAVSKLEELVKKGGGGVDPALLQTLVDRLLAVDRALIVVAIADASGGDSKTLAQALDELMKGDRYAAEGKEGGAIDHYRHAWERAQKTVALPPDQPPRPTKRALLEQLTQLEATLTDKHELKALAKVIDALARSLGDDWWLDDSHLQGKDADKVFDAEREAVHNLGEIMKDKDNTIADAVLEDFQRLLVGADRALTVMAIAGSGDGDPKRLGEAMDRLERGDAAALLRKYEEAIDRYREAWKSAGKA